MTAVARRRRRGTTAAACALVAALPGCATLPLDAEPGYPATFPRLAPALGDCTDLGGTFANRGIAVDPADGSTRPALLARDVLGLKAPFEPADHLRLTVTLDRLPFLLGHVPGHDLAIASDAGVRWQSPTRVARPHCDAGRLVHFIEHGAGGLPGVVAAVSDSARLARATDGSLIAKRAARTAGIALIVPFATESGRLFFRFPQVPDSPAARIRAETSDRDAPTPATPQESR